MVLLTMKDRHKIAVLERYMDGIVTVTEAGKLLGTTERQVYRLLSRLRDEGVSGVIHGNRGRVPWNKTPDSVRVKVLRLVGKGYSDINDTHLSELLAEREDIHVHREVIRRWLRAAKHEPKRKRRGNKYRKRRERKESFGIMLQIDASDHDWLEGRGSRLVLVGAKDDATGYTWAQFVEAETTWAYLNLMEGIFIKNGLPLSLYSDRHSIFYPLRDPTIMEQLKGLKPTTQFGRAMEGLGIQIIPAYSAPAKGRIERLFGVLQDRLIVELRLAGIKTKDEANAFLEKYLKTYNQRFTVPPRKRIPAFRKTPCGQELARILCLKHTRTVNKDHTVSFEGLILQIPQKAKWRSFAREKVNILQLKDGSIEIIREKEVIARFNPEAVARLVKSKSRRSPSELKQAA